MYNTSCVTCHQCLTSLYHTGNLLTIYTEGTNSSVKLKDVMRNEKVKIQPVLLCLADYAGRGGCKEAMQQMLELPEPSQIAFSSSQIVASKKYHLADVKNDLSLYNFGFQSYEFAGTLLNRVSNIPSFQHHLLDEHMKSLIEHLHNNQSSKEKVITNITRGASLIKVWNVSVNFNSFHFLRGFSGHLANSHLWLFADLADLLQEFEDPLVIANDGNITLWSFQSDYLLRSTLVCNNSTGPVGQKRKPCRLFSLYSNQKGSDRKAAVAMPKPPEEGAERPANGQNGSNALPSFHHTKNNLAANMQKSVTSTLSPPRTTYMGIQNEAVTLSTSQDEPDTNEDVISKSQPPYISQDEAADIQKLEEELHHIARQLKVTELLEERVTPLNITRDGKSTLQSCLRSILAQSEEVTIPVSWLFLRGALEHSKKIFMKKAELCEIAEECGIIDKGFAEFCEKFTSFGSILDISLKYKKSDTIIIKTDEFLSKLGQVFDSITTTSDSHQTPYYAKNGIITTETVHELFGPEGKLFMTTLSEIGTVAIIPAGRYDDGSHDECYYMPCARKMKQERSSDNVAVRILLSIEYPATLNYEVAFTKYMLSLCPAARLQSSDNENVTIIIPNGDKTDRVTMIYRGDEIGIEVKANERHLHYIKCVLSVFESIAEEAMQDCSETFTYAFASMCKNEFHMLPHELCGRCQEKNEVLQVWMEALKEVVLVIPHKLYVYFFASRNQYKRSSDLPLVSNTLFDIHSFYLQHKLPILW